MKNKVNKRLLKYTSAAGVSAFALVSALEAAPTNFTNFPGILDVNDGQTNFDLDGDGNLDIRVNIQANDGGDSVFVTKPFPESSTIIFTSKAGDYYITPFSPGNIIWPDQSDLATPPNNPYADLAIPRSNLLASDTSISTFNHFGSDDDFLVFSFDIGGNTHYGWLQFKVEDTDTDNLSGLRVTSFAGQYESVPTIAEPSAYTLGLGLLAAGVAGIRARRRMKKIK